MTPQLSGSGKTTPATTARAASVQGLVVEVNHWYSTSMTNTKMVSSSVNSRSLLLPYTLVLIGSMLAIQAVVALAGSKITLLAGALTAAVAVGILIWVFRHYRHVMHVRFGLVIAHAITFAVVTTSFNLHAVVLTVSLSSGEGGFESAAEMMLSTPWFGATLLMSTAWGLGLLIHLLGTVLGRGWED